MIINPPIEAPGRWFKFRPNPGGLRETGHDHHEVGSEDTDEWPEMVRHVWNKVCVARLADAQHEAAEHYQRLLNAGRKLSGPKSAVYNEPGRIDVSGARNADDKHVISVLQDMACEALAHSMPADVGAEMARLMRPDEQGASRADAGEFLACRGASFHVDHFDANWPESLFWVVALEDSDFDVYFPENGIRIPIERGTLIVFDPLSVHGVVPRGALRFDEQDLSKPNHPPVHFVSGSVPLGIAPWTRLVEVKSLEEATNAVDVIDLDSHLSCVDPNTGQWASIEYLELEQESPDRRRALSP
jgi:hypothetical protein